MNPQNARQYEGWSISAALKMPKYRLRLAQRCTSDDFTGTDRVLFDAMCGQKSNGKFDIIAFQEDIGEEGRKRLLEIEKEYLLTPDEYVYDDWIAQILLNAERRNASASLQLAMQRLKDGEDVESVYGDVALALYRGRQRNNSNMVGIDAGVNRVLDQMKLWESGDQYTDAVPTGFARIDRILGGMLRKNITTVAGRPGAGKTQWAIQVARNVALWSKSRKRDSVIVIFSAEMSLEQLTIRLASCASGVPVDLLKENKATDAQKKAFKDALAFIRELPIRVDETPSPTTAQMFIRVAVEAMLHKDGVDLVIFDYLELAGDKNVDREEARLGGIMRGLKVIAKHFNCPVMDISQLNREVEKRSNKVPETADLRGSGWVEALSQAIILLMRPEHYGIETSPGSYEYPNEDLRKLAFALGPRAARFEISKNRDGKTGIAVLRFDAPITRFYEDGDSLTAARKRIEEKERKQKNDEEDLIETEAA